MKDISLATSLRALDPSAAGNRQAKEADADTGFNDALQTALDEVNKNQEDADELVEKLMLGGNVDIHEAMLALNKADVSFKLLMEVRNKIIEAYKEVMRMQV